jgi:hypothetical protein
LKLSVFVELQQQTHHRDVGLGEELSILICIVEVFSVVLLPEKVRSSFVRLLLLFLFSCVFISPQWEV